MTFFTTSQQPHGGASIPPPDASSPASKLPGSATTLSKPPALTIPSIAIILEAIHDFDARSPDELNLRKGEKVEVVENDDEFNDGWYLGRKATGEQGLFPKVYTAPSAAMHNPRTDVAPGSVAPDSAAAAAPTTTGNHAALADPTPATASPPLASTPSYNQAPPQLSVERDHLHPRSGAQTPDKPSSIPTPPLSVGKISGPPTPVPTPQTSDPRPLSSGEDRTNSYLKGLRSPVVDDTLSDIEEAISEISKNKALRDLNRRHTSMPTHQESQNEPDESIDDSGSEYSIPVPTAQDFGSDEEDDSISEHMYDLVNEVPYTKEDVLSWSPEEVAQYLHSRGLPVDVCDRFEEQEVNGSILLELEMAHLKELDIGSFGKRFKVWKEIEYLTKNLKPTRSKSRNMSDAGRYSIGSFADSGLGMGRSRSNSVGTVLPRIRSQHSRPPSRHPQIDMEEMNGAREIIYPGPLPASPRIASLGDSPVSPRSQKLPPSNRHSLNPVHAPPATAMNSAMAAGAAILAAGGGHQRASSFDRNWTTNAASGSAKAAQGKHKTQYSDTNLTIDSGFSGSQPQTPSDRHYFSSCELSTPTSRERRVLHKKQSSANDTADTAGTRRHSRIESTEELFKKNSLSASLAYHMDKHKRKSASFSGSINLSQDNSSAKSRKSVDMSRRTTDGDSLQEMITHPFTTNGGGGDSVPDSVISSGKAPRTSDSGSVPSITVSTPQTPSKGLRKGKKHMKTGKKKIPSALEKGIRQITPTEAAAAADYSGWIKKRGSSGVGAWKSRFFVLQGRRLSYFYSMNDTKERGLIDITSHKVLPSTDDRIVGIHAALAAVTSPSHSPKPSPSPLQKSVSPPGTSPTAPASHEPESGKPTTASSSEEKTHKGAKEPKDKGWFVFKLVPPAPGAAKGVTFTPPRLHYFATETREEGKKWMAAMMKATIDRDETQPVITSYNAKTISLAKARELRARPPSLGAGNGAAGSGLGIELGQREGDEADVEDADEVEKRGSRSTDDEKKVQESIGMVKMQKFGVLA